VSLSVAFTKVKTIIEDTNIMAINTIMAPVPAVQESSSLSFDLRM
jgi:hypothetical protein